MNRTFPPEPDAGALTRLEAFAAHFADDFNRGHASAPGARRAGAGFYKMVNASALSRFSRRVALPAALAGTQAPPTRGLQQFVSARSPGPSGRSASVIAP